MQNIRFEPGCTIYHIARNLENWIRNLGPNKSILFVAHSMGGLVVRKLITSQIYCSDPLDKMVRHITFIASPHNGTNWATLAHKIPFLQKAQLGALIPTSPFLLELNDNWQGWSAKNVPRSCAARSIFGSADDVVPVGSAACFDAVPIPLLGKGHRRIR
jgi:pimeloyl-ACP methyl ester carboxylesterase